VVPSKIANVKISPSYLSREHQKKMICSF